MNKEYLYKCLRKYFSISLLIFIFQYIPKYGYTQDTPFNKKYSVACHNCFEPKYALNIEDVLPYTKTIEIDIWDSEIASGILGSIWGDRMNRNWFVKHAPQERGNVNCCGGSFQSCLIRLNDWSNQNPNHDVMTVFIDKKENWSDDDETRKPQDIDQLLLSIFPKQKIFTPSILVTNLDTITSIPTAIFWPSLDSLKGKFIFIITNGTEITSRNPLNEYLNSQKSNAVCFVAPEINNEMEIRKPLGIENKNLKFIFVYNLKCSNKFLTEKINTLNYLNRVYGCPESNETINELKNKKVNFIALYNYRLAQ